MRKIDARSGALRLVAVTAVALTLGAGVVAAEKGGSDKGGSDKGGSEQAIACQVEECRGTKKADQILGGSLDQEFLGLDGNDYIHGGGGKDTFSGGKGNDVLIAIDDHDDDVLDCGPGDDTAFIDTGDSVENCEAILELGPDGVPVS